MKNSLTMKFNSISENEKFARNSVASFLVPLDPTISELDDIKTAVSEAVTNCIVHGYEYDENGEIEIKVEYEQNTAKISVSDNGVGIKDLQKALAPFYTTKPDSDRSGMGFTLMQSFMDDMQVYSEEGKGTTVVMTKKINNGEVHA